MKHVASRFQNGKTITIAKGDILSVVLHYTPARTAWSFEDNFGYNPNLSLGLSETKDGVKTMEFTACIPGTVEIALYQSSVLGIPGPSNITDTFKLTVKVL